METIHTKDLLEFTPRELEIIRLLTRLNTRKQISKELGICYKTVDFHMNSISKKTGLHGQMQLIAFAQKKRDEVEETNNG